MAMGGASGRVVAGLVVSLLVATAVPASGVPLSGAVDDPRDAPADRGPRFPDAKRLAITYDPLAGAVTTVLELHEPFGTVNAPGAGEELEVWVALGATASDGDTCTAAPPPDGIEEDGDVGVYLWAASQGPVGGEQMSYEARARVAGDPAVNPTVREGSISADRTTFTWTTAPSPALAGRDIRCVGGAATLAWTRDPEAYDRIASFVLAGPAPSPVVDRPVLGPPAPPVAPPSPQVAATDVRAPVARIGTPARSRAALLRRGLVVRVTCDEACTVRSRLILTPGRARLLGLPRVIGTSRVVTGAAGRRVLTRVRPGPASRRALRARGALRATVVVTLTDAAGNTREVRRPLVLR